MSRHADYKRIFHERVLATGAKSVLDVGCGRGDWVHELREVHIQAVGLDTAQAISMSNPWIKQGRASALPFEDQSVDIVASEFSAHHFEDIRAHLSEAFRVARRGVAILDAWFDDSIPSQRNAHRMDDWMKTIDRAAGEVHHPVISAGDFIAALPADAGNLSISFEHLLSLETIPQDTLDERFAQYAEKSEGDAGLQREEAGLRQAIAADGISEGGAIIFLAVRA